MNAQIKLALFLPVPVRQSQPDSKSDNKKLWISWIYHILNMYLILNACKQTSLQLTVISSTKLHNKLKMFDRTFDKITSAVFVRCAHTHIPWMCLILNTYLILNACKQTIFQVCNLQKFHPPSYIAN